MIHAPYICLFLITPILAFSTPTIAGDPTDTCNQSIRHSFANIVDSPTHLTIHNDRAYLISADTHLIIIDLSTPDSYPIISSTELEIIDPRGISVSNDESSIYIHHRDSFSIYNNQDPIEPWFLRTYPIDFYLEQTLEHNNTLYPQPNIALDITNPNTPHLTPQPFVFSRTPALIKDNTLYTSNLTAYDLSTTPPTLIHEAPDTTNHDDLIIKENAIITQDFKDIYIYQFQQDRSLTQTLNLEFDEAPHGFGTTGSRLFISLDQVHAYDISNPSEVYKIAEFPGTPGTLNPTSFTQHNTSFITLSNPRRIARFEFQTNPISTHATRGQANELVILNKQHTPSNKDLSLVIDDQLGLTIYDITDPHNTSTIAQYQTPNTALGLASTPTHAFIASHQSGLEILDITDPSNPTPIANYNPGSSTQDIEVIDNIAYLVNRTQGLHILDVSDPSNPTLISSIDTTGHADDLTIHQHNDHGIQRTLALISHGDQDHAIIDVTDPFNPTQLSTIPPPTQFSTRTISMNNEFIYTADNGSYRVFDASDLQNPFLIATHNTNIPESEGFPGMEGSPTKIAFGPGSTLIIANGPAGIATYNNVELTRPTLQHYRLIAQPNDLPSSPTTSIHDFIIQDTTLYTATRNGGFRIYDLYDCNTPCPIDFNLDGSLNFFDLSIFLEAFNHNGPIADLNNDSNHDFFDISIIFNYFTNGCP